MKVIDDDLMFGSLDISDVLELIEWAFDIHRNLKETAQTVEYGMASI